MGCSSSSVDTGTQFVTLPQQTTRPGTLVKQNGVNNTSEDKTITQNTTSKELLLKETKSHPEQDLHKSEDTHKGDYNDRKIESEPPPEKTIEHQHPIGDNKVVPSAPFVPTIDLEEDYNENHNRDNKTDSHRNESNTGQSTDPYGHQSQMSENTDHYGNGSQRESDIDPYGNQIQSGHSTTRSGNHSQRENSTDHNGNESQRENSIDPYKNQIKSGHSTNRSGNQSQREHDAFDF